MVKSKSIGAHERSPKRILFGATKIPLRMAERRNAEQRLLREPKPSHTRSELAHIHVPRNTLPVTDGVETIATSLRN